MDNDKLIAKLRSVSVETGSLACLGCGHENNCGIHGCAILRAAADALERMQVQLADLQTRFDRVNDFEQSQCAKVMVKLAERDAQLAAAVVCINDVDEALRSQRQSAAMLAITTWCGAQSTDQQPPAWAEQFERRFLGGEGGG